MKTEYVSDAGTGTHEFTSISTLLVNLTPSHLKIGRIYDLATDIYNLLGFQNHLPAKAFGLGLCTRSRHQRAYMLGAEADVS